ncbi:hypothetical protein JTB14_019525 [Gonioctena quinquepunctata]|nr:hypothetical protein JTB14_019525 [Gonioctena quinquepunctata]
MHHFSESLLFILIYCSGCWGFNPYCWIRECKIEDSTPKNIFFDNYNPYCWIWKCEKTKNGKEYTWSSLNPYCWIKECSRKDELEYNKRGFSPYCWFTDCDPEEFSFWKYITWTNKHEEQKRTEENTDHLNSWIPDGLNPYRWYKSYKEKSKNKIEHSFGMSDFVGVAKSYLSPQVVSDKLKSLQISPGCWFGECCNDHYIPGDVNRLTTLLEEHVYGQHLVNEVSAALNSHLAVKGKKSKKALALSFHGWVGSGKNYVASLIAQSLFKLGTKSKYVHLFSGRVHFTLESAADEYRRNLHQWLKSNITLCERQLFIFDEVEKMPEQVLNDIKPFLDYKDTVDGADYTKAIFLFISNIGSDLILERYEELMEVEKKTREEVELRDFEHLILEGAFNAKGGFHHSDIISYNLIDHYIPFLPMEKKHVLECIKDEFRMRNVNSASKEHVEYILESIRWGLGKRKQFSKTGCKSISSQSFDMSVIDCPWKLILIKMFLLYVSTIKTDPKK